MRSIILLTALLVACGDTNPNDLLDAWDAGATPADGASDSVDPGDGAPADGSADTMPDASGDALDDVADWTGDSEDDAHGTDAADDASDAALGADADAPEDAADGDATIPPVVVNSWEPGTAWQVTLVPGQEQAK